MINATEVEHWMHLSLIAIKDFTKMAFHGAASKLRIIFTSDYYVCFKIIFDRF